MTWVEISAGTGPIEVQRCVPLLAQALFAQVGDPQCIEPGPVASMVLHVDHLPPGWEGTHVVRATLRGRGQRSRWYLGVRVLSTPARAEGLKPGDVRFKTCRAGGPGGQHVNTTDSAVIATHGSSGIRVRVASERSQHANRRVALRRLEERLILARDAEVEKDRHRGWERRRCVRQPPTGEWLWCGPRLTRLR